ncbi:Hypothetical predicted protein [Octopus vulgaris]|uniref:Uncharacterized protein n=1 Tax=Octopus vulgaris TaxID=6645 RepID=A0AA36EWQ4_OCTVU|nr:Hypothetical predicted protein [Octopus vulgaris]
MKLLESHSRLSGDSYLLYDTFQRYMFGALQDTSGHFRTLLTTSGHFWSVWDSSGHNSSIRDVEDLIGDS